MNNVQQKPRDKTRGEKPTSGKKSDMLFYIAALAAVIASLIFVPQAVDMLGISFLEAGTRLNKLLSVVAAVGFGWVCLMPSQGFKSFVELSKGARVEWRKTVKPDRDTVLKTTMMVLVLVVFFSIVILLLDGIIGWFVQFVVN